MFDLDWSELKDVLEEMAPTTAQRDRVARTVDALRRQSAKLPRREALHQIVAGIWLTMSDEGPQVLSLLEELTRTH